MLGMENHFDISGGMAIREVDIAGLACIFNHVKLKMVDHTNLCFI